jgi:Rhabdovirus nucleocapsid protein
MAGCFRVDKPDLPSINYTPAVYTAPVEYPTDWFTRNRGSFPPCATYLTDLQFPKVAAVCNAGLRNGELPVEWALLYMRMYCLEKLSLTLTEDWVSMELTIGRAAQVITPLNLIHAIEYVMEPYENQLDDLPEDKWDGIMLFLLLVNRSQQGMINQTYQNTLDTMFREQLIQRKCDIQVARMKLNFSSWWTNLDYNRFCCAIDMFLFKSKDKFSFLRLGTIHLRDKDCGLKVSLDTFIHDNSLRFNQITQSMYTEKMADELYQLTARNEEMERPDSYAHYVMAWGLTSKSPYSTSHNPNLHLWLHTVGVLMGKERSRNARMVPGANERYCVHNAIMTARMIKATVGMAPFFDDRDADGVVTNDIEINTEGYDDFEDDEDDERGQCPPEPKDRNPKLWLKWLFECPSAPNVPTYLLNAAYEQLAILPACRDKTIGQYLKQQGEAHVLAARGPRQ